MIRLNNKQNSKTLLSVIGTSLLKWRCEIEKMALASEEHFSQVLFWQPVHCFIYTNFLFNIYTIHLINIFTDIDKCIQYIQTKEIYLIRLIKKKLFKYSYK